MKPRIDIHSFDRRYAVALEGVSQERGLTQGNKLTINRFLDSIESEGIGIPRRLTYTYWLKHIGILLRKDFEESTIDDIRRVATEIERSNYTDYTKDTIKVMLKRFYKWLRGTDDYPPEVKWIRLLAKKNGRILPEEILTEDDVKALVDATDCSRDRALVLTLYESGCRIGELLTLRIRNIQFDEYGAVLIVAGKTGMRRVRIVASSPALAGWLRDHPGRDNPDSPLWILTGNTNHGQSMTYPAALKILRQAARKAHLKKAVNPHMFRHSRASHLATKLTEAQMKQYLGWTHGSDMAAVYVHLSGRDVDDALLRINGIEMPGHPAELKLKVQTCSRCDSKNDPSARFCNRCSMPLDMSAAVEVEEARVEADQVMTRLLEDSEVRNLLLQKLKELN